MDENRHEIEKVVQYWRSKGAWTCIRRLISWGGSLKLRNMNPEKLDRIACGNAVGLLPITWDGIATICVMDIDAKYPCGDLNKETIKDVWQRRNENFVKYHMQHEWNNLPSICLGCEDWLVIGEERFDENGKPAPKNYKNDTEML